MHTRDLAPPFRSGRSLAALMAAPTTLLSPHTCRTGLGSYAILQVQGQLVIGARKGLIEPQGACGHPELAALLRTLLRAVVLWCTGSSKQTAHFVELLGASLPVDQFNLPST